MPTKFEMLRLVPAEQPNKPIVTEYIGQTWVEDNSTSLPSFVLGLMDKNGYYYAVAGGTTCSKIAISVLGRNTDSSITQLFLVFDTVPNAGDELVDSILGLLAGQPLDEANRYMRAIAWATEFDKARGTLTFKEVKSWFLFWPTDMNYLSADSLPDGTLCSLALADEAYIGWCKCDGQSHLSANTTHYVDWENSRMRFMGTTTCGLQVGNLSEKPGYESCLTGVWTLDDKGDKEITCPRCAENAKLLMRWHQN